MPYDWKQYPVINLNISKTDCSSAQQLNKGLCIIIQDNARELGIELSSETESGYLFGELINKAKDIGKVVILIDEYDKPLIENIYAPHIEEVRQVLENFYINIKASDEHLRFVFMTGVTKFSKWYNGFRFNEEAQTVYNPVSLGMFFIENGKFSNYWFSTGSPSFIFKVLKQQDFDFYKEIKDEIEGVILDSFDVTNMSVLPLLLQTGYLTIESGSMMMGKPFYKLNFPNYEIENSFQAYFVSSLEERNPIKVTSEIAKLQRAMLSNDTASMQQVLISHIAAIPYANRSKMEENYQNIIYSLFRLLGAEIHNEVHINNGRIDCVIVNRDHIYIFEFKMNQPAKIAIAQIKEKGYANPYMSSGKPIALIGINFSKRKRNIVEWLEEVI